jgi:N-methylhydantoinase B
MELRPGQLVIVETPGAGGYGPMNERRRADIETDQRSGKFSAAYLRRHYGSGVPEPD